MGNMGDMGQGASARAILILCECIWNVPVISLVLPDFEDTSSLWFPLCQVVYPPGSPLDDYLSLPCRK